MTQRKFARRAALFDRPAVLFCPANRASAIDKAKASGADMVILDLEDAVPMEDKPGARDAAIAAVKADWPMPVGIRVNGLGHGCHSADLAAASSSEADFVVLPLVADGEAVGSVAAKCDQPVAAMIETALGVTNIGEIADAAAMLIVGTNDLAADLRLPAGVGREGMMYALERTVMAARARGIAAYDGVHNRIDDAEGLEEATRHGYRLGFDGKTVIHPSHIAPVQAVFAPSEADVERARAILAHAEDRGGAINFEGEMVEAMHVASAKRVLERAGVS
ncbi:CoA ester lyase [Sphingomicrobium sp. XHP0239]|uniref:HpcH/HpaI aldolase/citrate lyase family protein n=1 Tax=Sphingomicrobium maritimum TaxID=3133972 RepID=UPI0031CC8D3C